MGRLGPSMIHMQRVRYALLLAFVGLSALPRNIDGQIGPSPGPVSRPPQVHKFRVDPDKILRGWKKDVLGFDRADAENAFFEDFASSKLEVASSKERYILNDLEIADLVSSKQPKESSKKAFEEIRKSLPEGYKVARFAKDLEKIDNGAPDLKLKEFVKLRFSKEVEDENGVFETVDAKNQDATLVDAITQSKGLESPEGRSEILLFQRNDADEKTKWRINFQGWHTLASDVELGHYGVWKMLQGLKLKSFKSKAVAAQLTEAIFEDVAFPWWDVGYSYRPTSAEKGRRYPYATWAWSSWFDLEKDDRSKLSHLYSAMTGEVPKGDAKVLELVLVEDSILSVDQAKERKKLASADKYFGYLKKETLATFSLSELKRKLKD